MKIKNDFVTNSSSTSFIIGDLTGENAEILVRINDEPKMLVDILKYIPYDNIVIDNDRTFRYEYDYLKKKQLDQMEEIVRNGGKVYAFSVADDCGVLQSGFCNFGIDILEVESPDIEIIQGEGGY